LCVDGKITITQCMVQCTLLELQFVGHQDIWHLQLCVKQKRYIM